jgi:hypothetical protein
VEAVLPGFFLGLFFDPKDGGDIFYSRNVRLTFIGLHGVISKNTEYRYRCENLKSRHSITVVAEVMTDIYATLTVCNLQDVHDDSLCFLEVEV